MKTILTTIFLWLMGTVATWAQNTVSIYQVDGKVAVFSFAEKPVVTYSGDNLVLTTNKTTVQYPIYQLKKLAFDVDWDAETKVEELKQPDAQVHSMYDSIAFSLIMRNNLYIIYLYSYIKSSFLYNLYWVYSLR